MHQPIAAMIPRYTLVHSTSRSLPWTHFPQPATIAVAGHDWTYFYILYALVNSKPLSAKCRSRKTLHFNKNNLLRCGIFRNLCKLLLSTYGYESQKIGRKLVSFRFSLPSVCLTQFNSKFLHQRVKLIVE